MPTTPLEPSCCNRFKRIYTILRGFRVPPTRFRSRASAPPVVGQYHSRLFQGVSRHLLGSSLADNLTDLQ